MKPFGVAGSWTLNFRDEFEGSSIDTSKWIAGGDTGSGGGVVPAGGTPDPGDKLDGFSSGYTQGDNQGLWSPANLGLSSGVLSLTVDSVVDGGGTRARGGGLISKWSMGVGAYEARIRVPSGVGTQGWFAWWLQTPTGGDTNNPAVDGIEMDLCEGTPWTGNSANLQSATHWRDGGGSHSDAADYGISDGDWHTYGFNWQSSFLDFYLDGVFKRRFTAAIGLNSNEFMMVNNASYTGGADTATAYVDYVRYWTGN